MFLDTIVVPVDFGPASQDVWRAACDLARLSGSHLHLVHVCAQPLNQAWVGQAPGVDVDVLAREWALEAAEHLAGFAIPPDIGAGRVTRTVLTGSAHREIVEFARRRGADAIVMGTHGYGPLRRFLLGSVAERVLRTATCPVMAIRPHAGARAAVSTDPSPRQAA